MNGGGDRTLRVALMTHTLDNRRGMGTATVARKTAEYLLHDGRFDVTLVHYDQTDDPLYRGAREIMMPQLFKLPFGTRFARFLLFCWRYRKEQFDIVHWFQPRLYPFFWLFPARRTVVTAHGGGDALAPHSFSLARTLYVWIMRLFHRKISAVVASSEFGKAEIHEAYGVSMVRIPVVYLGGADGFRPLPHEEARTVAERYGARAPYILTVSRLVPHKNVEGLIKAYTYARNQGIAQSLVIVGGRGGWQDVVYAAAEASPHRRDIIFLDYVAEGDLNALYAAADLFVFPSFNEGWGMPVIEAFASGTPVVASNATAIPEAAGDAAVLVDPHATEAIGRAMCRVLQEEPLRREMTAKGLARSKEFTWPRMGDGIAALYKKITLEQ